MAQNTTTSPSTTCAASASACTSQSSLAPNADVSGVGIFVAFFTTAFLTLLLATAMIGYQTWELIKTHSDQTKNRLRERSNRAYNDKWTYVLELTILNFSDQQLVTGLAMSSAVLFSPLKCDISVYHYDMVCYYIICSIITHLCCISALRQYFEFAVFCCSQPKGKSDPSWQQRFWTGALTLVRIAGIALTIISAGILLSSRSEAFPILTSAANPNYSMNNPASCFFQTPDMKSFEADAGKAKGHGTIQFAVLVAFSGIALLIAFFHNYSPVTTAALTRQLIYAHRFVLIVRVGSLLATWGIFAWTFNNATKLRNAMESSGWIVNNTENDWGFSQLVSVLIMSLALIALLEAIREKYGAKKKRGLSDSKWYSPVGGG